MSHTFHSVRHVRLASSLLGLLAVVIVMGACALSSQAGTSTGSSGGASTGPTATATIPGVADEPTQGPAATATTAPPTPTKTATPGGIICCITVIPLPSVHQVFQQQTLTSTSTGPVTVACPAGEVALSGSWATSSSDGTNALVYNSTRNGAGGWKVYVQHSGSTLVNAYAMCLKNASSASVVERFAGSLSVNPNTYGSKYASCNAGETLVGGGFASSNGLTLYNFMASGATWGGYVYNHTGSALPFSFYAECLTYSGSHSSLTSYTQATGHTVSNACPSGSYVSGGGFAANQNSHVNTMSATSSGQAWEVYDTPASLLNAYAMCVFL